MWRPWREEDGHAGQPEMVAVKMTLRKLLGSGEYSAHNEKTRIQCGFFGCGGGI
jgi:hypothetical protein